MPRYYFHTEDGQCYPDDQGTVLEGVDEAQFVAVQYLCERLKGKPQELWDTGNWRMTVQDETRLTLFLIDVSATFSASFPLSARTAPVGGP